MLAGVQHHLSAAQHSLSDEFVRLRPGHSRENRRVSHSLHHHEHIRRRTAANAGHCIKESLRHFFEQTEGTAEFSDLFHFFRAHLRAAAGGRHTGSHKSRRVGHQTNDAHLFAKHFLIIGDAPAGHYTDNELVLRKHIPDLAEHIVQKLRFDTEEQNLGLRGHFPVVSGHVYAVERSRALPALRRMVGSDYFLFKIPPIMAPPIFPTPINPNFFIQPPIVSPVF